MGFSPVTSGGGGTSAHLHTNAASDGGSLDSTSLMSSQSLQSFIIVWS
jgi:hypothetical protein